MRRSNIVAGKVFLLSIFILLLHALAASAGWRSQRTVIPGVQYVFIRKDADPLEINIIQMSLDDPRLSLQFGLAGSEVLGNATLSDIVHSSQPEQGKVVAAINGDFFRLFPDPYQGDPIGLYIENGEVLSFPYMRRSSLVVTADKQIRFARSDLDAWASGPGGIQHFIHGLNESRQAQNLILFTPRFGPTTKTNAQGVEVILRADTNFISPQCEIQAEVTEIRNEGNSVIPSDGLVLSGHGLSAWFLRKLNVGDTINLSIKIDIEAENVTAAIGGGPMLIEDGQIVVYKGMEAFSPDFFSNRHPRTAVGYTDKSLLFVTVDGRQKNRSRGMSLPELAKLMLDLGCKEAMNLDGGGSTSMYVQGMITNSPSDGRERAIANALMITSSVPEGELATLEVAPYKSAMLDNETIRLYARGEDYYGNKIPIDMSQLKWSITPSVCTLGTDCLISTTQPVDKPTNLTIEGRLNDFRAETTLRVYPTPVSLCLFPKNPLIEAGEDQQFIAVGISKDDVQIPFLLLHLKWQCSPELGNIRYNGYLETSPTASPGVISARYGDAEGRVDIKIAPSE